MKRAAMECWLRPNYRVMIIGMVFPACLLGVSIILSTGFLGDLRAVRWVGIFVGSLSMGVLGILIYVIRLPRIAYANGHLLLYLRSLEPIIIPIHLVECFFLGQASSQLRGRREDDVEATTVVVRIAENAVEWHRRDTKPALGHWCDGYITIRGTWCEPLSIERVDQLNRKLVEAQRIHSTE